MPTDTPTIHHPDKGRLLRANHSSPVSHWPDKEEAAERTGQEGAEGRTETGAGRTQSPRGEPRRCRRALTERHRQEKQGTQRKSDKARRQMAGEAVRDTENRAQLGREQGRGCGGR